MRGGRRGLKAALRAYVAGHDRGWEADRKLEAAEPGGDASEGEIPWSSEPEGPRFGVGVPDELDFHRGPDTWRSGPAARPVASGGSGGRSAGAEPRGD